MTALVTLVRIADRCTDTLGRIICWLILVMVALTCAVVAMRYAFNLGSTGLQESVVYLHGLVFMLGIPYTLKHQGHVRVDILQQRWSDKTRAMVDIAGTVLFLIPFSIFLLVVSYGYVEFAWRVTEGSAQPGGLPGVFLLKTLIPVTAVFLLLQGIVEILRNIGTLTGQTRVERKVL